MIDRRGQNLVEYVIFVGIVVIVLVVMTPVMRRGVQSVIKVGGDMLGNQDNADQSFTEFGFLNMSDSQAQSNMRKDTLHRSGPKTFSTAYVFNDVIESRTYSRSDLGVFINRETADTP